MFRYLIIVAGDVDPFLYGPYSSEVERTEAARAHKKENGDKDGIFWFDSKTELAASIGSYPGKFFMEMEDE